ncbi:peptidyl-prolyl cis-trans isomerase [Amphibacillus sp. MSJ-3]|uniref:peptidylprolyl isomerase n=1 Tax=Amphibacillus sp. MSJ-3 TaxID=2841505 RepID=UPI001C0E9924|nr:peptidyl-prolyl cis-trans isomerase [Amphibacillus sp. MSJ-3]MBU5595518.1 peptidyl-prolyl cis-trans isomerase [Amphibacillus sp. MSJ-3]
MRKLMLIIILVLMTTNVLTYILMNKDKGETDKHYPPSEEIDEKEPVATINEEEIYYEDWMRYLETHFGEEGLKEMIDRQVITELADQNGFVVDPEIIDLEVAFLATLAGQLPEDQVEATEQEWRETLEYRLLTDMLFTKDVDVKEEDIQTYYETYQSQYHFSHRVELSHIVVDDQETADRVYQELEDGADFQALAYEYSIDDDSRPAGGYLGFYTKDSNFLPVNYFDQTNDMEQYSYSEPFQGDQGYVILYLHRELPEIELDYEQLKEYIRAKIAIEELGETPTVDMFWDDLDIDWIY